MLTSTFRLLSVILTAWALSAGLAHLFALPNKINFTREEYPIVQQIYRGCALLGIVVVGALVSTLILTVMVREYYKMLEEASAAMGVLQATDAGVFLLH